MADVKEAAIALGNVYRRAGDARLRLAARMQMARPFLLAAPASFACDSRAWSACCLQYLSSLIAEMEATYLADVKPLKKAYGARRSEARDKARSSTASSSSGGGESPGGPAAAAADSSPSSPGSEEWRPLSAQLRHAAAAYVATFAPRVVAALHEFAAHEAASFNEVRPS